MNTKAAPGNYVSRFRGPMMIARMFRILGRHIDKIVEFWILISYHTRRGGYDENLEYLVAVCMFLQSTHRTGELRVNAKRIRTTL